MRSDKRTCSRAACPSRRSRIPTSRPVISLGGVIATIAGNGFTPQLSDPGAVGGFVGTLVQIAGLLIAVPAGVAASRLSGSGTETPPTSPTGLRPAS